MVIRIIKNLKYYFLFSKDLAHLLIIYLLFVKGDEKCNIHFFCNCNNRKCISSCRIVESNALQ